MLSARHIKAVDRAGSAHDSLLALLDLPSDTSVCELHTDGSPDLSFFQQLDTVEQQLVARAVDSRKSDFGDARWCAHELLRSRGKDAPILRADKGMPVFPAGTVGTLSHTEGLRCALVGDAKDWQSVGLDVEKAEPLTVGVFHSVTSPTERWALSRLAVRLAGTDHCEKLLGTVLFSAKESVYKSWFPLTGRFLDFDEAELSLEMDTGGPEAQAIGGRWRAQLLASEPPVEEITGSWVIKDGFVATVCGVRPSAV